jgi:hypothetical protein
MNKVVVKKSIIFGIILLFILANIIPCIGAEIIQLSTKQDKKDTGKKNLHQTMFSNPPKEIWNKTFGGVNDDFAYEVQQTNDEGFIIGGSTKSYGIAIWNPWLIKTDINGNEKWNRTYNYYSLAFLSGYVQSVQQTNDGGYILGCSFFYASTIKSKELTPFDNNNQEYIDVMMLIKTDSNGNEQWNRTYYGLEYSWCYCVRQTNDGGFIATGGGNSTSDGFVNIYLLKTYPNGTLQWLKTYGTSDMNEEGHWVQQTSDEGYIITGMSDCNYDTDWGKIWLIKTDPNGNLSWNKKFEGNSRNSCIGPETYGNSVQQTSDNGLIIAGIINTQGCLIKTDYNGNEIWRKTPFINDFSFFCYSGKQTSDGGYIITGFGLIKTDNIGNEQWNVSIPTPFLSGQQTNEGGYVIAGSTSGYYGGDVWLIKFGLEDGTPNLKFTIIGGFGVHLKITNNGTINSSGIPWQIHVDGGIFGLINYTASGTVDIAIGETKTVRTKLFYGFGDIQITANVDEEMKTVPGTQLFILTIIKK